MSAQATMFELTPIQQPTAPVLPIGNIEKPTPLASPVDQVRRAFAPARRLSAALGFILGGFVPVATFTLVHAAVATHPALWLLVAGGLLYSALSVFGWAQLTFESTAKALGFVLLTEGVLTFAPVLALSIAALLILVSINGISATVALQTRR